jgi:hypothetical protein
MQKDIYDKIISFLQGASWAVVLFGALITFKIFSPFGIAFSIFITIFFIFVSLFLILVLDALSIHREKLQEMKKQTKLLEKIASNND